MRHRVLIHLLCAVGALFKGETALIETQQTVTAAVGEDAVLSCRLIKSKDVVQVTWQKLSPEGEKNLATYTKTFGQRVNPAFEHKVEFKDAGLQNCSIIIRNVTEQDEGCYHCLFNTNPEGAFTATTCLKLYELHQPILHVGPSDSTEEAVVSCSATGRPAPTLTLTVLRQDVHFSNYSSVSVSNTNGTVTVTTTAVLPRFHDNSTPVRCAVQVPSGPQREAFVMIPVVKQSSVDGFHEESAANDRNRSTTVIVLVAALCVGIAAAVTFFLRKQEKQNRDLKMNEMSDTTIKDTHRTEAPSAAPEHEQFRQRTLSCED